MPGPITLDSLQYMVHREMAAYFRVGTRPVDADIYTNAVARGLDRLLPLLPPVEASVTVATSSRAQNIGALLDDIYVVDGLCYPWPDDDDNVRTWEASPTEETEYQTFRFADVIPQAGETIRVRYRRLYHIQGLDGAQASTLPELYVRPLVLYAAAEGLRYLATRLGDKNTQSAVLMNGSAVLTDEADTMILGQSKSGTVSWSEIGL